jgi:hypothetical protein
MAMRINAKQIEIARWEGPATFHFNLKHQEMWGFPKSPYAHNFVCPMNWEYVFKRTDITPENKAELDRHWTETYTETYTDYVRDVMTPKTEKQLNKKREQYEAIKSFTKAFLS